MRGSTRALNTPKAAGGLNGTVTNEPRQPPGGLPSKRPGKCVGKADAEPLADGPAQQARHARHDYRDFRAGDGAPLALDWALRRQRAVPNGKSGVQPNSKRAGNRPKS